jgi:hypothetical protein
MENGLSEANLQSSKTSRDSYLDQKLAIFVRLLEFCLVTTDVRIFYDGRIYILCGFKDILGYITLFTWYGHKNLVNTVLTAAVSDLH